MEEDMEGTPGSVKATLALVEPVWTKMVGTYMVSTSLTHFQPSRDGCESLLCTEETATGPGEGGKKELVGSGRQCEQNHVLLRNSALAGWHSGLGQVFLPTGYCHLLFSHSW